MSPTDALKSMQRLIHMFGGRESWDEATIAAWAEQIAELHDVEAAHEATRALIKTFDQPGRPPFAVWLRTYQQIRQKRVGRSWVELPPVTPIVPPSEYLRELANLAEAGDVEANTEIGLWRNSAFARAILGTTDENPFGIPE